LHPINETETFPSIVKNRYFPSLMPLALQDQSGKILAAYKAVIAAVAVLEEIASTPPPVVVEPPVEETPDDPGTSDPIP
jgi:hypothetical protein